MFENTQNCSFLQSGSMLFASFFFVSQNPEVCCNKVSALCIWFCLCIYLCVCVRVYLCVCVCGGGRCLSFKGIWTMTPYIRGVSLCGSSKSLNLRWWSWQKINQPAAFFIDRVIGLPMPQLFNHASHEAGQCSGDTGRGQMREVSWFLAALDHLYTSAK